MAETVSLGNDITLDVHRTGQGTPEVLYIHGFGDSHYVWTPLLEYTAQPAIVPSLRGFGHSSKPTHYSMDAFAEDMILLLDVLGIERIHIVGHSLGSYIAQRIAIHYADRVNRLVLIGSAARKSSYALSVLRGLIQHHSGAIALEFIQQLQAAAQRPLYDKALMAQIAKESTLSNFRVWNEVLRIVEESDHYHHLSNVMHQTLILWGKDDALYPRERQEELRKILANARLEELANLGHAPFLEKPQVIAQHINTFLS